MQGSHGVGNPPGPVAVRRVPAPTLRHRMDDLSRHALAPDSLVPGHLVGDQPEDWGQRPGVTAGLGPGELPDGIDMAPQAPPSHDPPRPRQPHRADRGG
jgi:hypothetical protein